MANLSYAQLKRVWLDASQGTRYHSNAWASLMAAIALAESSGDPNNTNPTDNNGKQTSWGLWQISNGTHSPPSSNWASPVVNAQLAIQKLDDPKQGLAAWGTYDSGAYKAYLNEKTTPSDTIPATGGTATQATAELTAAQVTEQQQAAGRCALGYSQHVGIFFGHGPTIQFCVISKSQVRAVLGGVYLVAGGLTGVVGVAVLVVATVPGAASNRLVRQVAKTPGAGKAVTKTPGPASAPVSASLPAAGTTRRRRVVLPSSQGPLPGRPPRQEGPAPTAPPPGSPRPRQRRYAVRPASGGP